jgi:hypothetical protein
MNRRTLVQPFYNDVICLHELSFRALNDDFVSPGCSASVTFTMSEDAAASIAAFAAPIDKPGQRYPTPSPVR